MYTLQVDPREQDSKRDMSVSKHASISLVVEGNYKSDNLSATA